MSAAARPRVRRLVHVPLVVALGGFSGAVGVACTVDGTTPTCTTPDSGCATSTDASRPVDATGPGDATPVTDAPSDAPVDASTDVRDGGSDADARPQDARADG